MSAERLRQLLDANGLAPGNIRPLLEAANAWFQAEPGAASYLVRSVFRELSAQDWDEEQGVPLEQFAELEQQLLAPLRAVLEAATAGGKGLLDAIDALAKARV